MCDFYFRVDFTFKDQNNNKPSELCLLAQAQTTNNFTANTVLQSLPTYGDSTLTPQ